MADIDAARRFLAAHFEDAGLPHVAGDILAGTSSFAQGPYISGVAAALATRSPVDQESVDDDWHLRGYAYASKQATICAVCGNHKHTPLRVDAMGGYVCLTCIDERLGSLLGEFGYHTVELTEFKNLYRAYVHLLETGRNRILDLGGCCDPVDVMENSDVDLREARSVIERVGGAP